MEFSKGSSKMEVYMMQAFSKKQEESQINSLNYHLKELEKEDQPKS